MSRGTTKLWMSSGREHVLHEHDDTAYVALMKRFGIATKQSAGVEVLHPVGGVTLTVRLSEIESIERL